MKELVKKHYSDYGISEWERLSKHAYHTLEHDTTMHFLRKYLPEKGLVLDAGGGPGRYTIDLANLGYDVVLLDLTPKLLEIAREQIEKAGVEDKVEQIIEGSIDDLSMFEDATFEAVICLGGALSHVLYKKERQRTVDELVRVARKNAPIFVSVISRLAVCMNTIVYLWSELETSPDMYRTLTTTGYYPGGTGFAPTHFYIPEELREEFKGKAKVLEMVGLEGIFSTHEKEYNEVYKMGKHNEILWETHLKTCTHPSVVGVSEHFMVSVGSNRGLAS
jgi:ubiquinone/menaquinone biosynthesis C-methylase UbiE